MRTDREGQEDTRCCDMKPGTGIFLLFPVTVETAGGENRGLLSNKIGVMQRSHDITEGKTQHREILYKQNTWAELEAINAQSSERWAFLKVEQFWKSSLTVSLQAIESSANLEVNLLDLILITASYEHKRIITFYCMCELFTFSSATKSKMYFSCVFAKGETGRLGDRGAKGERVSTVTLVFFKKKKRAVGLT